MGLRYRSLSASRTVRTFYELELEGSCHGRVQLPNPRLVQGTDNILIISKEIGSLLLCCYLQGICVGACALSSKELLEMPTDVEGKTEIFAKILNDKKEIAGKVKLACRYEPYVKESGSKKSAPNAAPAPATPLPLTATLQTAPPTAPMSGTFPESSQHSSSLRMSASASASASLKSPLKPGLIKDNFSTTANMSEQGDKPYTPAPARK